MEKLRTETELAWEEVCFWQDFVTTWIAENHESPEPRALEALENAWRRYESALQRKAPGSLET